MVPDGTWQPDPTGRCELRLQVQDGSWTDHVSQGGRPLIDPWELALADPRPMPPFRPGDRVCFGCGRGRTVSEDRCGFCGSPALRPVLSAEEADRAKASRRRLLVGLAAALVVLVGGLTAFRIYENTGCRGYRNRILVDIQEIRDVGIDSLEATSIRAEVEGEARRARAAGCDLSGVVGDSVGR